MNCPGCAEKLAVTFCTGGRVLTCSGCGGTAITIEFLKKFAPRDRVDAIWRQARATREPSRRSCPSCESSMGCVHPQFGGHAVEIDTCRRCRIVWFDESELPTVSPDATEPTQQQLDAAAARLGIRPGGDTMRAWRVVDGLGKWLSEDWGPYVTPWDGGLGSL